MRINATITLVAIALIISLLLFPTSLVSIFASKGFFNISSNSSDGLNNKSPMIMPKLEIPSVSSNTFGFYTNYSLGFRIIYPTNWGHIEESSRVIFTSPLHDAALVVGKFNVSSSNLGDILNQTINLERSRHTNYQLISSSEKRMLSDNPAFSFDSTYLVNDIVFETRLVGAPYGDHVYYVAFLSPAERFPAYDDTWEKMMDSFRILEF